LLSIAEAMAASDPVAAEHLARNSSDPFPFYRARALAEIAKVVGAQDPAKAEALLADIDPQAWPTTADSTEEFPGPSPDAVDPEAWPNHVAEATAHWDPVAAEHLARTITDPYYRARALAEIAKVVGAQDPAKAEVLLADAEHLAQTITASGAEAVVVGRIAEVMARHHLGDAERLAKRTAVPTFAMARIAAAMAVRDPAAAERLARTITNPVHQAEALVGIAETLMSDVATGPTR
jgi:hypothetical protein